MPNVNLTPMQTPLLLVTTVSSLAIQAKNVMLHPYRDDYAPMVNIPIVTNPNTCNLSDKDQTSTDLK